MEQATFTDEELDYIYSVMEFGRNKILDKIIEGKIRKQIKHYYNWDNKIIN